MDDYSGLEIARGSSMRAAASADAVGKYRICIGAIVRICVVGPRYWSHRAISDAALGLESADRGSFDADIACLDRGISILLCFAPSANDY